MHVESLSINSCKGRESFSKRLVRFFRGNSCFVPVYNFVPRLFASAKEYNIYEAIWYKILERFPILYHWGRLIKKANSNVDNTLLFTDEGGRLFQKSDCLPFYFISDFPISGKSFTIRCVPRHRAYDIGILHILIQDACKSTARHMT